MGCFIDQNGNYYEGDNQGSDTEVLQRPNSDYEWNGTGWILDPSKQKIRIVNLMQSQMDAKAQAYGYDNILSAASYALSTNDTFRTQGTAFAKWRDDVWAFGLSLMAATGKAKITTDAQLLAAIPLFPLDPKS